MSVILNIESSGSACSVALSVDGAVEFSASETEPMHQSTHLAPYVAHAMEEITRKELKPDAVAVSIGPGSYTGLRIGMSLAKGLAYSLNVPLIGVETLKILAVKAMFRNFDFQGDEILMPMVDARRMEVYTAAYNFALEPLIEPQAMIVTKDSLDILGTDKQIYLIGDGAAKTKDVLSNPNIHWMNIRYPMASDMVALSEKALREKDFMDLAYGTPMYIKEYNAVHGDNPLKQLLQNT